MGSAFDTMQAAMFNVVENQFGFEASWAPLAGGTAHTGKVLFLSPTEIQLRTGAEFLPNNWQMEYFEGAFPGLKESVDAANVEVVIIDGTAYDVRQVSQDYDGKNFKALLTPQIDY